MKQTFRFKNFHQPKGQSLVEVAIAFTIILMLIAGAFDLGSAYYYYIALRDAAQEGAIFGSVCEVPTENPHVNIKCSTNDIINRIKISSNSPIDFENDLNFMEPSITFQGEACTGGEISVKLVYNYQIVMPLIGSILDTDYIPLTAEVTNTILLPRCENEGEG